MAATNRMRCDEPGNRRPVRLDCGSNGKGKTRAAAGAGRVPDAMSNPGPSTEDRKKRVFLVDDHPIVRERLAELINQDSGFLVCGEADDAITAIKAIGAVQPDIAIVDITLKDTYGIELIKSLREKESHIPVLVLSMHHESVYGERALHAGARGYLNKQEGTKKVVPALRAILAGEIFVSDKLKMDVLQRMVGGTRCGEMATTDPLSDREFEVLQLLGRGQGVRDIAEALFISPKTVEAHRAHIRKKMKFPNSAALLRYAIEWVLREGESNAPNASGMKTSERCIDEPPAGLLSTGKLDP